MTARDHVRVRRALLSVSDKTGLIELGAALVAAGIELVSTGSTLKMNGLREVSTILESSARLIANDGPSARSAAPEKKQALDELVMALGSVLRGRGKRYVMANVPRTVLEKVKGVLPGINGPTVVDVLGGGAMVAVHAVVDAKGIYRIVASLKSLGCEGILVTRIERLMP